MSYRALEVTAIHGGYPEPAIAVISVIISYTVSIPFFNSTITILNVLLIRPRKGKRLLQVHPGGL